SILWFYTLVLHYLSIMLFSNGEWMYWFLSTRIYMLVMDTIIHHLWKPDVNHNHLQHLTENALLPQKHIFSFFGYAYSKNFFVLLSLNNIATHHTQIYSGPTFITAVSSFYIQEYLEIFFFLLMRIFSEVCTFLNPITN